ncbi:MAG TPA: MFS transporter [Stellaceae bacterium]|nr:MFS transporter [Stellaceae bacterium]
MLASPTVRFAFFTSVSNVTVAVLMAFWPLWLTSRGLDATEIGVLGAVLLWVRVPATPLLGMLADRSGKPRLVMLLLAGGSLAVSGLFIPAYGFLPILVISTAFGTLFWSIGPLAENAILSATVDYGRVKIWGSFTFLVMTVVIGRVLVTAPRDALLALLLAGGGLILTAIWLLPAAIGPIQRHDPGGWRPLLHPRQVLFFAAAALIQASHVVYYSFSALYWGSLGYSTDAIGWLWAEGVVAEMALFYWSGHLLRRVRPTHLMALGGIAGVIRWTTLGTASALPALAAVNFLHCFTFAAAHVGAMFYLLRNTPSAHAGTGQSLYTTAQCVGFGVVWLFSGALYEAVGGSAFLVMAGMAALGALAALWLSQLATNS